MNSCTKDNAILIPDGTYKGQWHEVNRGINSTQGLYLTDTTYEKEMTVRNFGDSIEFGFDGGVMQFLRNKDMDYGENNKIYTIKYGYPEKNHLTYIATYINPYGPSPSKEIDFKGIKQ